MPDSFVVGTEILKNVKDLVNIPKHCKVVHVVAIFLATACTWCAKVYTSMVPYCTSASNASWIFFPSSTLMVHVHPDMRAG